MAMAVGNDQAAARNGAAAALRAAGARRPRVFTIRISARVLLQVLVFAMVLYQVRVYICVLVCVKTEQQNGSWSLHTVH